MTKTINNCFDSHVHFWATGQVELGLKLNHLTDINELKHIKLKPQYFRDHWLVGFGWDDKKWVSPVLPNIAWLDQLFPDFPVFLSRIDGHSSWINTKAIEELKKKGMNFDTHPVGGLIQRDQNQKLTGVLQDQAHIQALLLLPSFSEIQHKDFLTESQKIFNRGGFTHVRDLSLNQNQWQILTKMSDKRGLTICLEGFVTLEKLQDFEQALNQVNWMKQHPNPHLRILGVKAFVDGSLGSQTAFISQNYIQSDQKGLLIWNKIEIEILLRKAWTQNLEVALHTIGDESLHQIILAARQVASEGILGRLHLEHAQLMRPETVNLMKPLHITCHLQPCHWLSDSNWLNQVIPKPLQSYLFSWELLRKNKIPFYFGSDSPIEPSRLLLTEKALIESAQNGIPELGESWLKHHQHPDLKWLPSWTEFTADEVKQVYFNGEPIL